MRLAFILPLISLAVLDFFNNLISSLQLTVKMRINQAPVVPLLLATVSALDLPDNLRQFRDAIVAQGQCNNKLGDGFHAIDGDAGGEFPTVALSFA